MTYIKDFLYNKEDGEILKIIHISPHPDDVFLGYYPVIFKYFNKDNIEHYFVKITDGSNAVSNKYIKRFLSNVLVIERERNNSIVKDILHKISYYYDKSLNYIESFFNELNSNFFTSEFTNLLVKIKGLIREYEENKAWYLSGIKNAKIIHFNANFYYNDTDLSNDFNRLKELLLKINPDVIFLPFDRKNKGPLTHYKVLKLVKDVLFKISDELKNYDIILYRNVWDRFSFLESNIHYPIDNRLLDKMVHIFNEAYGSQVEAMYPNKEYNDTFAEISRTFMEENLSIISCSNKIVADDENIGGYCFLKYISKNEFLKIDIE